MKDESALDNLEQLLTHLEMWMDLINLIQRFDGDSKEFNINIACKVNWEHLDWRHTLDYLYPNEDNFVFLKNDLYSTAKQWGFRLE